MITRDCFIRVSARIRVSLDLTRFLFNKIELGNILMLNILRSWLGIFVKVLNFHQHLFLFLFINTEWCSTSWKSIHCWQVHFFHYNEKQINYMLFGWLLNHGYTYCFNRSNNITSAQKKNILNWTNLFGKKNYWIEKRYELLICKVVLS